MCKHMLKWGGEKGTERRARASCVPKYMLNKLHVLGRSSKQAGSPTFGPYGQCQGQRFPYQQCTLKNSANNLLEVYEQGELQPWTSGTLFTPTNVKYD